ncbi:MAG: S41 family peptidase [Bacteroidetes bacterium]|nr:S41 family peptidase [Bacteroidota bacterium]
MKYVLLLVLVFVMTGCTDLLLGPQESAKPTAVFDAFWKEFDARYSYFDVFSVNWDSLYSLYRPRISNDMPDSALAATLDSLIVPLHDAHVSLYGAANGKQFSYNSNRRVSDSTFGFSENVVSSYYLGPSARLGGYGEVVYGSINDSLGYMHIGTFIDGDDSRGWADRFEYLLDSLRDKKALIVDIRGNGGGSVGNFRTLASEFIPTARPVLQVQFRNGPAHSDFSQPEPEVLSPKGKHPWTKPVALLTDRYSISAAEWFTLALRTVPSIIQIGDTTNGSFSGRLDRELANGWLYSMSIERVTDVNGISFEGKGIPPHIVVARPKITTTNRITNDVVLDRAIEELSK